MTGTVAPPAAPPTAVGYASPTGAAHLLRVLFVVGICLNVVGVTSTLSQISLLQTVAGGDAVSDAEASANDSRQRFIAALQLVVYLATVIVFLLWIDRVYANVAVLSSRPRTFGQRWAVGAWFVPVLNLVRPFQIVREAWWMSSEPATAAGAPPDFRPSAPPWLAAWWATFLASALTGRVASMVDGRATSVDDYVTSSQLWILSDIVMGTAAALAIMVVLRISRAQDRVRV